VLEEAGIIERRIDRQWRYIRIQPKALGLAETWLAERRRPWTGALDRLAAHERG
jgi:DNA-binding transcriptional ArsR family regulator